MSPKKESGLPLNELDRLGEALCSCLPDSVIEAWPKSYVLSVSGGMDSMLLFFGSMALFRTGRIAPPKEAFYLNHGLRTEADKDEKLIEGVARLFSLDFYSKKIFVKKVATKMGWSLEEAGRNLRYRHLYARTTKHNAGFAVLAHHADDYLESLLLHLIRGGGQRALSTLPLLSELPVRRQGSLYLFRPFVYLSKKDIREIVKEFFIPYKEDASNQSPAFRRNRLRAQVLPLLRSEGLDTVKLWKNFHETSAAEIFFAEQGKDEDGPQAPRRSASLLERTHKRPDYIRLDRRLLATSHALSLGGLKSLLDPALLALGLPSAERKMLGEILRMMQGQMQKGSVLRWENKECLLWASPGSDLWVVKKTAACLRPFRWRTEKNKGQESGQSILLAWNHKSKVYHLLPKEEAVNFQAGMVAPLPNRKHKKLKKVFQEYGVPPFVRTHIPLFWERDSGFVRQICLSFWEGKKDVRF